MFQDRSGVELSPVHGKTSGGDRTELPSLIQQEEKRTRPPAGVEARELFQIYHSPSPLDTGVHRFLNVLQVCSNNLTLLMESVDHIGSAWVFRLVKFGPC